MSGVKTLNLTCQEDEMGHGSWLTAQGENIPMCSDGCLSDLDCPHGKFCDSGACQDQVCPMKLAQDFAGVCTELSPIFCINLLLGISGYIAGI